VTGYEHETDQDVRHMLGQLFSVARRRHWAFIVPAALGALVALGYTFTYPRVYKAKTMFERRDSMVLANLIRSYRHNPYSFPKMRQSIYVDIKGYKAVDHAVSELGLDKDLPRDDDGKLTEEGQRMKQALVNKFSADCAVYLQDKSDTRDIITMQLPNEEPEVALALVTKLRDSYITSVQARMTRLLQNAQEYFRTHTDKKREDVTRYEEGLVKFRSEFLGVDPANPDAILARMSDLRDQQEDLTRRIEELESEIRINEEILSDGASATTQPGDAKRPKVMSVTVAAPPTEPNPAYVAVEKQIQKLKATILEHKMTMTDEHPVIRRARLKIAQLETELSRIPPTISATDASRAGQGGRRADGPIDAAETIRRQDRARARVALRRLKGQLAKATKDLAFAKEQMSRYESQKGALFERREDYLRRQTELAVARNELNTEMGHYNHVTQLLNAEQNKRGITFVVMEDTQVSPKPVSPEIGRLITVSFGFGVAVGLACVLLLELLDRTFRSVGQVSGALKLPVLQSIGQIITPQLRRRRLAKQVVMHVATTVLVGLVCLASGLVYLSLERPQVFHRLTDDPGAFSKQLLGIGP